MQIWPAIDLRGGKCVRLQQGDYQRETIFGEDPLAMARHLVEQGAEYLHLVDLDGARDGKPANLESIAAIAQAVDIPCELGGGIREEQAIAELLELGLSRLVIGTQAVAKPDWFREMCHRFPHKMALGIDARDGWVATHGWLETSQLRGTELARQFADEPVAAIIFTDIATDGMLAGPNIESLVEMRQATRLPLIASGGVTTAADVSRLEEISVDGCIIGRSLYEGKITLAEVYAALG